MTLFRKSGPPKSKIEKRVEKIATSDLTLWADQSLFSLGREISQWQRNHDLFHLTEAESSAEALLAVVREIKRRSQT
jgi:hypothetical protein